MPSIPLCQTRHTRKNCHAMPRHTCVRLPHTTSPSHPIPVDPMHAMTQIDAIALSPAQSRDRGRSRRSDHSSPSKRSHAQSPSCSRSHSRSHSPPRHRRRRHVSPNANGRRSRLASSSKGKTKGSGPSFFQAGTDASGSVCAVCLGRHEHEYAKCSATKLWNGKKACIRRNDRGRLVLLDGLPICFNFQTNAGCTDTSHPSRHICSGCGTSGHGAQHCAQAQKN